MLFAKNRFRRMTLPPSTHSSPMPAKEPYFMGENSGRVAFSILSSHLSNIRHLCAHWPAGALQVCSGRAKAPGMCKAE